MNRREVLLSGVSIPAALSLPGIAFTSTSVKVDPSARWFAVIGNDEFARPIWATTIEEAGSKYVSEHDVTMYWNCPTCSGIACEEHINVEDWEKPSPNIYVESPDAWDGLGPEREPNNIEWMNAGFYVNCESCGDDEPQQCQLFEGETVCADCLHYLRHEKLGRIIGDESVTYDLPEPKL